MERHPIVQLFKHEAENALLNVDVIVDDKSRSVTRRAIDISRLCCAHYNALTMLEVNGVMGELEWAECGRVFEGAIVSFYHAMHGKEPSGRAVHLAQMALLRGVNMFASSQAFASRNVLNDGSRLCRAWMLTPVWLSQFCATISMLVRWRSDLRTAQKLFDALCELLECESLICGFNRGRMIGHEKQRKMSSLAGEMVEIYGDRSGSWIGHARLIDAYALCRLLGTLFVQCENEKEFKSIDAKLAVSVKDQLLKDCVTPLFYASFRYAINSYKREASVSRLRCAFELGSCQ
jgi:hypothetical protein